MARKKLVVGFLAILFVACLGSGVFAGPSVDLTNYMFVGKVGDAWHYQYTFFKNVNLDLIDEEWEDFTVEWRACGASDLVQIATYEDEDDPDTLSDCYLAKKETIRKKTYFYLANNDCSDCSGSFEPDLLGPFPTKYPLETVIPHPANNPDGEGNDFWYFKKERNYQLTTMPGVLFRNVIIKIDLDKELPGNVGNTYYGIDPLLGGVTHVVVYAKGIGEIANMDYDFLDGVTVGHLYTYELVEYVPAP